jgi:hypothetical protein
MPLCSVNKALVIFRPTAADRGGLKVRDMLDVTVRVPDMVSAFPLL